MPTHNTPNTETHYDTIDLDLGKKLKALRRQADKTQAEIAHYLDISPQQYQKYEKGSSKCNIANVYKLATYYDRHVSELLPGGTPTVKETGFEETPQTFAENDEIRILNDEADAMAQLLAIFVRIPSKPMRRKILNLLNEMF